MYTYLEVSDSNRVTCINISRRERLNSLGISLGKELLSCLTSIKNRTDAYLSRTDTTDTPRMLVLSATPEKSIWIAGGDLKELSTLNPIEVHEYIMLWSEICLLLRKLPIPTIAVVTGACLGGGAELAMSCDLRMMTDDAYFSFKQVQIGLSLGYGTTALMTRLLGEARARSILLQAKTISSKEAETLGLVEKVSTKETLDRDRHELIQNLLALSPHGIATQKKNFELLPQESETLHFLSNWGNPDHRKFLNDFKAKP
ncbi:MAG: enoyl-CoA hydratase/isomerase family protein [Pseudomonadota bacterium]